MCAVPNQERHRHVIRAVMLVCSFQTRDGRMGSPCLPSQQKSSPKQDGCAVPNQERHRHVVRGAILACSFQTRGRQMGSPCFLSQRKSSRKQHGLAIPGRAGQSDPQGLSLGGQIIQLGPGSLARPVSMNYFAVTASKVSPCVSHEFGRNTPV